MPLCPTEQVGTIYSLVPIEESFFSTNTGNSWSLLNNGLKNKHVTSLAVEGATLIAGTYSGLYVSGDTGSTWSLASSTLDGSEISSLTVVGTSIFVGTWDQGVLLSTHYGNSWTSANSGLYGKCVNALGCIGTKVFAGFMDGTISRTTDLGKSWSVVSSASSRNSSSQSLAAIGNTILAWTSYYDDAASGDGIDWIPTIFASNVFAVGDSIAYTISNSGACASRERKG